MRAKYCLPRSNIVVRAAREVLKKRGEVNSLAQMRILVLERLKRDNPEYRLSGARLLKILALSPEVRIKVDKRKARQYPALCPLCGSEMEDLYRVDLFGKRVKLGKKCVICGYSVERRLKPKRYKFYI